MSGVCTFTYACILLVQLKIVYIDFFECMGNMFLHLLVLSNTLVEDVLNKLISLKPHEQCASNTEM